MEVKGPEYDHEQVIPVWPTDGAVTAASILSEHMQREITRKDIFRWINNGYEIPDGSGRSITLPAETRSVYNDRTGRPMRDQVTTVEAVKRFADAIRSGFVQAKPDS